LNKDRFEIELLSKSYRNSKRILKEVEAQLFHLDRMRMNDHQRIVMHIENVIESLDERERFILEKEVLEGKTGNWYLEYFSMPSYYRLRRKAYSEFLRCL